MSKLAPTPFQTCSGIVQANIRSRCAWFGLTSEEKIAKKIGINRNTYHLRVKNPVTWTLEELIQASISLKVPLVWLMTDHSVV